MVYLQWSYIRGWRGVSIDNVTVITWISHYFQVIRGILLLNMSYFLVWWCAYWLKITGQPPDYIICCWSNQIWSMGAIHHQSNIHVYDHIITTPLIEKWRSNFFGRINDWDYSHKHNYLIAKRISYSKKLGESSPDNKKTKTRIRNLEIRETSPVNRSSDTNNKIYHTRI